MKTNKPNEQVKTPNDKTRTIEADVQRERKPTIRGLMKLWAFVFSSTKLISCVYLGLFILLSLLRPLMAFIWGDYITTMEGYTAGARGVCSTSISYLLYLLLIICYATYQPEFVIKYNTSFPLLWVTGLQELVLSLKWVKMTHKTPHESNDRP
jgi:hypothetical protein